MLIRDVGLPRQRPDAEEIFVHHDEERSRERRSEEEVEVAANPTEQGGWECVHLSAPHLLNASHHLSLMTR